MLVLVVFPFVCLAQWSLTASMSSVRFGHTATKLHNGKVLICGGYNGTNNNGCPIDGEAALTSCELFDPTTGNFSMAGSMLQRRTAHTATLLNNGDVLICGGNSDFNPAIGRGSLSSCELYDATINQFKQQQQPSIAMSQARDSHAALLLNNTNAVLLCGGYQTASSSAHHRTPFLE